MINFVFISVSNQNRISEITNQYFQVGKILCGKDTVNEKARREMTKKLLRPLISVSIWSGLVFVRRKIRLVFVRKG